MRMIYKRILSFCMAWVMLFCIAPLLIPPVQAEATTVSSEDDLRAVIEPQIRAFAKSINKTNADDAAAKALAKHGLAGGGKKLSVGKTHALTATLMNSELALATIIESCRKGISFMQRKCLTYCFADAGCNWSSQGMYYTPTILNSDYAFELIHFFDANAYDNSLIWMAGSMEIHIDMSLGKVSKEVITYNITAKFEDRFDFSMSGSGGFKDLISGIGALLFREFDWESKVTFQLEVPNECEHSYQTKATQPTCTTKGYTTYTCALCNYSYKANYSNPQAHTYASGICTVCGAEQLMGDLSEDGLITSTDVVLLRRYIAGGYDVTLNPKAADLSGDGLVTATDVVLLRRYIAGGYGITLPQ